MTAAQFQYVGPDTSDDAFESELQHDTRRKADTIDARPIWEIEGEGEKVTTRRITQPYEELLGDAAATIKARGAKRDSGQERSMARAVRSFSALTGLQMTEVQGWQFMAVLKLAREQSGHDRDNYLDAAAYIALAAECAMGSATNYAYEDGAA